MKLTRSFASKVVAWSAAFAVATGAVVLPAQVANPGTAKAVRIKGAARYTTGDNRWHPLSEGDVLKAGAVIQTASNSQVDLLLSDREEPVAEPFTPALVYHPEAEARINLVRMYENTVLAVDKLTWMETGADRITETQLDLRAGRIFGTVKKLSGASRYEVKIPNGVAGIRGTVFDLDVSGLIKVLVGLVIESIAKPDGTVATQVVKGGQMYNPATDRLTDIPNADINQMRLLARECGMGRRAPRSGFPHDWTIRWFSPKIGYYPNPIPR